MNFYSHLTNFGWDYFALYTAVGANLAFSQIYRFQGAGVRAYAIRSSQLIAVLSMVWNVWHNALHTEQVLGWTLWSLAEIALGYVITMAVLRLMLDLKN